MAVLEEVGDPTNGGSCPVGACMARFVRDEGESVNEPEASYYEAVYSVSRSSAPDVVGFLEEKIADALRSPATLDHGDTAPPAMADRGMRVVLGFRPDRAPPLASESSIIEHMSSPELLSWLGIDDVERRYQPFGRWHLDDARTICAFRSVIRLFEAAAIGDVAVWATKRLDSREPSHWYTEPDRHWLEIRSPNSASSSLTVADWLAAFWGIAEERKLSPQAFVAASATVAMSEHGLESMKFFANAMDEHYAALVNDVMDAVEKASSTTWSETLSRIWKR